MIRKERNEHTKLPKIGNERTANSAIKPTIKQSIDQIITPAHDLKLRVTGRPAPPIVVKSIQIQIRTQAYRTASKLSDENFGPPNCFASIVSEIFPVNLNTVRAISC